MYLVYPYVLFFVGIFQKQFGQEFDHRLENEPFPVIIDDACHQKYDRSDNGIAGNKASHIGLNDINQHE